MEIAEVLFGMQQQSSKQHTNGSLSSPPPVAIAPKRKRLQIKFGEVSDSAVDVAKSSVNANLDNETAMESGITKGKEAKSNEERFTTDMMNCPPERGVTNEKVNEPLTQQPQVLRLDINQEKNAHSASLPGSAGAFPQFRHIGQVPPMTFFLPWTSSASQKTYAPLLSLPKPKRCTMQSHIAHTIHQMQQFMRMNISMYGAQPLLDPLQEKSPDMITVSVPFLVPIAPQPPAAAGAATGFNYAGMQQNAAFLQNNGYTFPVPAHVAGVNPYPMPAAGFLNGSFSMPQMIHPAYQHQLQPPTHLQTQPLQVLPPQDQPSSQAPKSASVSVSGISGSRAKKLQPIRKQGPEFSLTHQKKSNNEEEKKMAPSAKNNKAKVSEAAPRTLNIVRQPANGSSAVKNAKALFQVPQHQIPQQKLQQQLRPWLQGKPKSSGSSVSTSTNNQLLQQQQQNQTQVLLTTSSSALSLQQQKPPAKNSGLSSNRQFTSILGKPNLTPQTFQQQNQ